jgi:hypothetical protein
MRPFYTFPLILIFLFFTSNQSFFIIFLIKKYFKIKFFTFLYKIFIYFFLSICYNIIVIFISFHSQTVPNILYKLTFLSMAENARLEFFRTVPNSSAWVDFHYLLIVHVCDDKASIHGVGIWTLEFLHFYHTTINGAYPSHHIYLYYFFFYIIISCVYQRILSENNLNNKINM